MTLLSILMILLLLEVSNSATANCPTALTNIVINTDTRMINASWTPNHCTTYEGFGLVDIKKNANGGVAFDRCQLQSGGTYYMKFELKKDQAITQDVQVTLPNTFDSKMDCGKTEGVPGA